MNSRVLRYFRRLNRRWWTVAADSFNRVPEEGLGASDTGHSWQTFFSPATPENWTVRNGRARLRLSAVGLHAHANLFAGEADARVEVRITIGTVVSPGVGLAFRGHSDGSTLLFTYVGGTTWRFYQLAGGATSSLATFSGPSLTVGKMYRFEVRAMGNSLSGYVDGALIGTHSTATYNQQMRHGIYVRDKSDHLFDNFKVFRHGP